IDRVRRRPVLVITDIGRAVLLVAIPLLAITGRLSITTLVIFMVIFGLFSLLHDAGSQSFLPRLVPRSLLPAANARLDQAGAVIQTSGPALAGLLVKIISAPWAVLVDAASYVASALLMITSPVPEPAAGAITARQVLRDAREGVRWFYRHPMLAPLAINTNAWFVCNAAAGAVLTPYAVRTLGFGSLTFGLAMAAAGVGSLIGALSAVRLGNAVGPGWAVIGCRGFDAVGWAIVALSPAAGWLGWFSFGLGQFVIGLGMGASNTHEMGYRQMVTPDQLQGRINAIGRSTNRAMIVIGAPLGGFLGEAAGYRPLLWGCVAGFTVVAITLGLSRFRRARYEDTHAVLSDGPV
ncbi:MAG: MFS transporter, partial [Microlunatus sp.]|nr:MFS transporter [Microlunatus sp.]